MQIVALSWLVYRMTQSAYWVGVVAASSSIPALIFSLVGGSIVDRFPKKQVLLITHIVAGIVALLLGFLAITDSLTLPLIIIFSLLGGLINSIYVPAHYSFISDLVDTEHISSAISINAAVSSLGRVIGPALAGIYYMVIGGIAFLGNLEIGYLAEHLGPQLALRVNAFILLLIGLYILYSKYRLRQAQSEYNKALIHE